MATATETIEAVAGTQTDKLLKLLDADRQPIPYLQTDALSAAIWSGDDQGVLAVPTVAWHGGQASTGQVDLTITADDVEALPPANYRLIVWVTRNGVKRPVLESWLRVKAAPGMATPLKVYGSYQDLLMLLPSAGNIQAESTQAQYAEERAAAREYLDEKVLNQCRGDGDRQYVRGLLDGDRLIQDRQVRELVACYALWRALDGRLSGAEPDKDPYPGKAKEFGSRATTLAKSITVRVDTSAGMDGSSARCFHLSMIPTYRG